MQIISIGEVLWDLFDQERLYLGGAPLNFSANSLRLGHSAILLSAVGKDSLGTEALKRIQALGLSTEMIQQIPGIPTGTAKVTMDPENHISFSIHRPAAFDAIGLCEKQFASLNQFKPDWIYFGTLAQTEPATERLVLQVLQSAPRARRFYDMNLRTGHWNLALVERLARLATVLKLNGSEAEILFREFLGDRPFNLEEFCRYCSSRFRAETVCVTLGGKGCAVFTKDTFAHFQGFAVDVVDTVGAGDAFAAAFLHGLDAQWPIERVARFANAVGAIVTTRAGAIPKWTLNECMQLLGSTSDPSAAPDVYDASSASGGAQR